MAGLPQADALPKPLQHRQVFEGRLLPLCASVSHCPAVVVLPVVRGAAGAGVVPGPRALCVAAPHGAALFLLPRGSLALGRL